MLGERFGHCEYAAARPESGGTRAMGECLVEPGKADGRRRAVPTRHGLECRVEVGAKIVEHLRRRARLLMALTADTLVASTDARSGSGR